VCWCVFRGHASGRNRIPESVFEYSHEKSEEHQELHTRIWKCKVYYSVHGDRFDELARVVYIYCINTIAWSFELSLISRRRRSLFKLKDSDAGRGGSWFVAHAIRQ